MTLFYELGYFLYTDDFQIYISRLICSVFFKPLLANIFSFMAYRDFKLNMTKMYPSTQTLSSHCVPFVFSLCTHFQRMVPPSIHLCTNWKPGSHPPLFLFCLLWVPPSPQLCDLWALLLVGYHGESFGSGAILLGFEC